MKRAFFLLFCLVCGFVQAQPGGGGGLVIYSVFDAKNNRLSIRDNLIVRAFIINDYFGNETSLISHEIELPKSDTISLYPQSSLNLYYTQAKTINIRLYFLYGSDTSIVDFYNVLETNPAGKFGQVDTLRLKSGYTSYSRVLNKDSIIIKQKPSINISFLHEDNLPQAFYLIKGINAINRSQYKSAIEFLILASKKRNRYGRIEEFLLPDVNYRLAEAYYNINEYTKAEEYAKKAIELRSNDYGFYQISIKSLIKLKKLNEALDQYNLAMKKIHYTESNVEEWIRKDRAFFNIKYLHNYDTVITEYQKIIKKNEDLKFYPNHSIYNALPDNYTNYFVLASAKYAKGDFASAYNDWLNALEFPYSSIYYEESLSLLDSVLETHKKDAMPYLLRAIALFEKSHHSGSHELSIPILTRSLNDLLDAEKLGLVNSKTSLWKAKVLVELERNQEALDCINLAIPNDDKNPELYCCRSGIWRLLGDKNWENLANSDFEKASSLSYQKKFSELNISAYKEDDFRKILFTIYDSKTKQIFPSPKDTLILKTGKLTLLKGKGIENQKLSNNFVLESQNTVKGSPNVDVGLYNDTNTGVAFAFLYRQQESKTIQIKKGDETMILVFSNLIDVGDILIDSIPFENGIKTINVTNIGIEKDLIFRHIKKEERGAYYKPSNLSVKLIRNSSESNNKLVSAESFYQQWTSPYLHEKRELNDTTYIYYGESKLFLFSKGIYKTYKYRCPKRNSWVPKFDEYKKDCFRDDRLGTWQYYDINGNLLLESHFSISFSEKKTIPSGTWKYYNKGNLVMEQVYKSNNSIETIYYSQ